MKHGPLPCGDTVGTLDSEKLVVGAVDEAVDHSSRNCQDLWVKIF